MKKKIEQNINIVTNSSKLHPWDDPSAFFSAWENTKLPKEMTVCGNFPGNLVVKNLPCKAGDISSIPGQRTKIPHAQVQLSHRTTNDWAHAL